MPRTADQQERLKTVVERCQARTPPTAPNERQKRDFLNVVRHEPISSGHNTEGAELADGHATDTWGQRTFILLPRLCIGVLRTQNSDLC